MSRRHESENEDDPEPFESSGEEWDVEEAKKEEKGGRRKSSRITKKPARAVIDESGSDLDDSAGYSEEDNFSEEEPELKKRKLTPVKKANKATPKKQKVTNDSDLSNDTNSNFSHEDNNKTDNAATDSDSSRNNTSAPSRGVHRKFIPKTIFSEDYTTGSFVILKKDAQGGDPSKHPVIWRIDGKALLQKYEAFDEEEKVRHKNTSIYTGWSPLDKDLYAPITVDVIRHSNSNLIVEVQWDKLKIINTDSD